MSEMSEQMNGIRELILSENEIGGDLFDLPCPSCAKPRSQRSIYIRCQPCGINWLLGDNLDGDPRVSRKTHVSAADEPAI